MKKVKIITDSGADLSKDLLERYDIDYVKMYIAEKRDALPQVSAKEFKLVFKKYLDKECDIVFIGCSSKQSGAVNIGRTAAKKLLMEYAGSKIYIVDSLNVSFGTGMLAIKAAELAKEGATAGEIAECILSVRKTVHQYLIPNSLGTVRKNGYITKTAAFWDRLLGKKPVFVANADGEPAVYQTVKGGRENALTEMVAMLKKNITNPENQIIYIGHISCPEEEVKKLVSIVSREILCREIYTGRMGDVIRRFAGPGAIGIWGYGKEVDFRKTQRIKAI